MMKTIEPRRSTVGQRIAGFVRTWLLAPLVRWHRRNELYREMMSLDDRTLADIGITRADVPYFVRSTPIFADFGERRAVTLPSHADGEPAHHEHEDPRLAA